MIKNIYCLKPYKDKILNATAVWLKNRRINADIITVVGLIAGVFGAVCLLSRQIGMALILLGFSIGADMLDGTVARLEKREKFSGKLLDSICDRIVETVWIGALIAVGVLGDWSLILAGGSITLFLCRWWAHRLGLSSSGVTVTRFERMVALILSAVFQRQAVSLIIYTAVSVGTFVSCFQIIHMILQTELHIKSTSRRTI